MVLLISQNTSRIFTEPFQSSVNNIIFPGGLLGDQTLIINAPSFIGADPAVFWRSDSVTTLRQGEGHILIQDLVVSDIVRCWLKSRHYLEKLRLHGKLRLVHKYVGKSGATHRGYYHTNVKGGLVENDIANQIFRIAVSPGGYGWSYNFHAIAEVPWLAIRRIEVVRRRFDPITGLENSRFPLILPIRFPGWLNN